MLRKGMTAVLCAVAIMLAVGGRASADEAPTPAKLDGVRIITSEEMKTLLGKKNVFIYDMRKALNYGKGHLQGAVSLPFKWLSEGDDPAARKGEFDLSRLPQDKEAQIVFHSDGPRGWKSYHAAKMTRDKGYKKVLWYRDGFDDWSKKGYAVEH